MNRRSFITGLCAPLIVPATSLDYVPRGLVLRRYVTYFAPPDMSWVERHTFSAVDHADAKRTLNDMKFSDGYLRSMTPFLADLF